MSVWENLKHLKGLNVVNLFAGMEVGRLACERAGVPIDKYYSSEIDKYAIQVSKANWPDIIHLGDVTKVYGCTLPDIHLLLGGSPCQGFSFAGKQLNFNDPRSALLFEYVRILKELREFNPNIYFLLENVCMKKEYQDVISDLLGVKPIMINSALVSAQNRKRLYWTNIPFLGQPADKGIVLRDILEGGSDTVLKWQNKKDGAVLSSEKGSCLRASGGTDIRKRMQVVLSDKEIAYMDRKVNGGRTHWDFGFHSDSDSDKSPTLTANISKGVPYNVLIDRTQDVRAFARRGRVDENGDYAVNYEIRDDEKANAMTVTNYKDTGVVQAGRIVGRKINPETNKRDDSNPDLNTEQRLEINSHPNKTNCLTTVGKDNVIVLENYSERCQKQILKNSKTEDEKAISLCANANATGSGVNILAIEQRPRGFNKGGTHEEKAPTLSSNSWQENNKLYNGFTYRKLTVTECERLQTIPDLYTQGHYIKTLKSGKQRKTRLASNSQAYKMLGNGWTADVIAHLLSPLGDYRFLY